MATKKATESVITLNPIDVKYATITIEGDGDIVLNKMNARNERALNDRDNKKVREIPNKWEDLATAIHWKDEAYNGIDTYKDIDEAYFYELLSKNAPCISGFGLKKSWGQAVVRNAIYKYATKFDNAVNVIADRGVIPITFAQWSCDERLMSPKKGSPVKVFLNHFGGWRAEFKIAYTENVFNLNSIVSIINLAGFGLGIGSGRTSGYGRYHVVEVKA